MKRINLLLTIVLVLSGMLVVAQSYSPFYKVAVKDGAAEVVAQSYKSMLSEAGYEIIGSYHPENKGSLYVVCYTSDELKKLSLRFADRGALGAVIRMGFVEKAGKTTVSVVNPYYMFYAYWGEQMGNNEPALKSMADHILGLYRKEGTLAAFGGTLEKDDLPEYHYKVMMPYFDDPDELEEFDSFEDGLAVIRKNLAAKKGNTLKVYEMVMPDKQIAVFGVGLMDKEIGEANFLPVIGEDHIAAMPYEIILQGKEATSLAGKYRFALYWPELTMGEFMKIMSTPGDVEDMLEALTK
jgi:type II secretory pathway pseudopilin PulG